MVIARLLTNKHSANVKHKYNTFLFSVGLFVSKQTNVYIFQPNI